MYARPLFHADVESVLCLDLLLLPQKLLTTWLIVPGSDTQELCLIENLNLNNFKLH